MQLRHAEMIAVELAHLLRSSCIKIEIAGSVRRGKPEVNDIEIVATPKLAEAGGQLFATEELSSQLNRTVARLFHEGTLSLDPDSTKRGGEKYRRFMFSGVPVDLFIVTPPAEFGPILAIRTGPADFSQLLVTPRKVGGAMPDGCRQLDGALWDAQGNKILCPTESAYFKALGLPLWDPEQRSADALRRYLKSGKEPQCSSYHGKLVNKS